MQGFKTTKLIVALGATLTLLSACDSKADKEAEPVEPTTQESALNESNGVAMPAEVEAEPVAVEEPAAATSFNPSDYYDLSQPEGAEAVKNLFFKLLAGTYIEDDSLAMAYNLDGATSENSFERQAALEKVPALKAKSLAYEGPNKFVVAMLPIDLVDQLREEESVTAVNTSGMKLLEYDFDKKAFGYTYNYNQSCVNKADAEVFIPNKPNVVRTSNIRPGFNGIAIDSELKKGPRTFENICYLPVADQELAAKIEDARLAGKVAFTGKVYLTVNDVVGRYNYQSKDPSVGSALKANIDADEIYLHTIEDDGSLSEPLSSHNYVFSKSL